MHSQLRDPMQGPVQNHPIQSCLAPDFKQLIRAREPEQRRPTSHRCRQVQARKETRAHARRKTRHRSSRLRAMALHLKSRVPAQLPTAFEVRLKTQWESADTTEPQGDVRYL